MKGFKAKIDNRPEESNENEIIDATPKRDRLSNEISKLTDLHKSGALTQEEFEKAKKKILDS